MEKHPKDVLANDDSDKALYGVPCVHPLQFMRILSKIREVVKTSRRVIWFLAYEFRSSFVDRSCQMRRCRPSNFNQAHRNRSIKALDFPFIRDDKNKRKQKAQEKSRVGYIFKLLKRIMQYPPIIIFCNLQVSAISSICQLGTEPHKRISRLSNSATPIKVD